MSPSRMDRWRARWRQRNKRRFAAWILRCLLGSVACYLALIVGVALTRSSLRSPPPSVLLRDRHGEFLADIGAPDDADYGYWPVDPLPPRVVAAALALEDRRFYQHPGVDPLAVLRAVGQNLTAGEVVSGASTVAMQVARMQDPGPRTLSRKAVEAVSALAMTARYGREAVLAHYLRLLPYGNRVRGVAYAARRYLDKPVEDLSWAETAYLCAMPQAPAATNPYDVDGRKRGIARAERILDALLSEGWLSADELAQARRELAGLQVPGRPTRPPSALHAVLRMEERLAQGDPLLQGRTLVDMSIDLQIQSEIAALLHRSIQAWSERGAEQGAVVVVDRETREVIAAVSSIDYFDAQSSGAIDYARTPRMPGSTLKPFIYALALERGLITPATILDDLARGPEGIRNADNFFLGPILPRVALGNSRNVPAVELARDVGSDEVFALFRALGLHHDEVPASTYGLSLAIGGLPVTLEQLVAAYGALAGDGRGAPLAWIRGESTPRSLVFDPAAARQITRFLADPQARLPAFPRMGFSEYGFPVAVKTGTSAEYRDSWAVAYSGRYIVGVWIGNPSWRPMRALSGFAGGARLAQQVMEMLHADEADGLRDVEFPPPEGYTAVRICGRTGGLATPLCEPVSTEYFPPGQEPTEPCTAHRAMLLDARNGQLASAMTPVRYRKESVVVDLGARYADWAAKAGLPRPPDQVSRLGEGDAVILTGPAPPPLTTVGPVGRGGETLTPTLEITSPERGIKLIRDPEVPDAHATLALRVTVDPPVSQVMWMVDGQPFELVESPYTTRWPLEAGKHSFQAVVPFTPISSPVVEVEVR